MGLAASSDSVLCKKTERQFWLHRVNRACLCLEQIFNFFLILSFTFFFSFFFYLFALLRDA